MNELTEKRDGCTCGSGYHREGNLLCDLNFLPVFSYGSLRVGERLHGHVRRFLVAAEARTTRGTRVETGAWYPGVIFEGDDEIEGEALHLERGLYKEALDRLDYVEGCPDLYERVKVTLDDGAQAWAYSFNVKREAERDGTDQIFA